MPRKHRDVRVQVPILPDDLWTKILTYLDPNARFAFASTCSQFRRCCARHRDELDDELAKVRYLTTRSRECLAPEFPATEGWCRWVSSTIGLRDREGRERRFATDMAASRGFLGVLREWRRRAARGKRIERLAEPLWDSRTLQVAAFGGHLEVLRWLDGRDGLCVDESTFAAAARSADNFRVLSWLRDRRRCPWSEETCSAAAECGNLGVLKWLRSGEEAERCPWDEWTCFEAAIAGQVDCLSWLLRHGCPHDRSTLIADAAFAGRVEVVRLLAEAGAGRLGDEVMARAAQGGSIRVLRWLRERARLSWTPAACRGAAVGGQLRALRWLARQGCPLDREDCIFAIVCVGGDEGEAHSGVLAWLRNGCRDDDDDDDDDDKDRP